MYAGGSDDFRGYVWKIPPISQLIAARNEISAAEWETGGMGSPVGMSSQNLHHLRRISPLNFSLFFQPSLRAEKSRKLSLTKSPRPSVD